MATVPAPVSMEGINSYPNGYPPPPNDPSQPAIIYPPPEIRNIVDKTAEAVARSGSQFEDRIREREKHNPKFCFLNPTDPYRAYYDFKMSEVKAGRPSDKKTGDASKADSAPAPAAVPTKPVPKQPPHYDFLADQPSISAQDLDILKLTAQFIARNGREFMTQLSKREMRNFQFEFLRSNHSLFPYFTKLVEQYTKVLMPPADLNARLKVNAENKHAVLERITERVEYRLYLEDERKKADEEADEER
ncbi:hypothetical protein HKX48_001855, partial [Thoreauomyces humboldtii]